MSPVITMELTPITKLLLWLLSNRPDIGKLETLEQEPMDFSQDPEDVDLNQIFSDLTPYERRLVQIDILEHSLRQSDDGWTA